MSRFYTNSKREHDKWSLPDAEVFYVRCKGCLPDSEPDGPYTTEQAAVDAWREMHDDNWEDES